MSRLVLTSLPLATWHDARSESATVLAYGRPWHATWDDSIMSQTTFANKKRLLGARSIKQTTGMCPRWLSHLAGCTASTAGVWCCVLSAHLPTAPNSVSVPSRSHQRGTELQLGSLEGKLEVHLQQAQQGWSKGAATSLAVLSGLCWVLVGQTAQAA